VTKHVGEPRLHAGRERYSVVGPSLTRLICQCWTRSVFRIPIQPVLQFRTGYGSKSITKKNLPDHTWISKLRYHCSQMLNQIFSEINRIGSNISTAISDYDRTGLHYENIGLDEDCKNIRSVQH